MKIIVCGGRAYANKEFLFRYLDGFHKEHKVRILIHGGAGGADTLAGEWAWQRWVTCRVYHADWAKYGKAAGPIRNKEMLGEKPHFVLAFPGGAGTEDMCRQSEQVGVRTIRIEEPYEQI